MKPIRLTLQAFGPFADRCEIEFEKLYSDGVYLITGDTGSGKTTIFDGITYCLYGSPSGNVRKSRNFRSKYARDDVLTYAELVFGHGSGIYTIKRTPEQIRPNKKDPTKLISVKAGVELILPSGEIIDSINAADRKIAEILGINRDQFKRTSMLAQGDFQKLLFAPTADRQEIFRRLFGTQNYGELQESIRLRTNGLKNSLDGLKRDIAAHFTSVRTPGGKFTADEDTDIYDPGSAEIVGELIDKDRLLIEENEKIIAAVRRDIGELTKREVSLSASVDAARKAEKLREEIFAEEKKLSGLKEQLGRSDDTKKKISALAQRIAIEENALGRYDELAEAEKKEKQLRREASQVEKELRNTELSLKKTEEELTAFRLRAGECRDSELKLERVNAELENIKSRSLYYGEIYSYTKKYNGLYEEYLGNKAVLADVTQQVNMLSCRYEELSELYFASQAGILAGELVQGQPCPVCGSRHHPRKARMVTDCPSKEELDELKEECSRAGDSMRKALADTESSEKLLENCHEEIFSRLDGKYRGESVAAVMEEARRKKEEYDSLRKKTEEGIPALRELSELNKKLTQAIPEAEKSCEKLRENITALRVTLADRNGMLSQMINNTQQMREELAYEDIGAAQKSLSLMRSQKKEYEDAVMSLEKRIDGIEKDILAKKAEISAVSTGIIPDDEKLLAECVGQRLQAEAKMHKIGDITNDTLARIKINTYTAEVLSGLYSSLAELSEEYGIYALLNETFGGRLSGRSKIELETYIQMRYFDRVLNRANTRFLIMSSGRYELRRRETPEDLRSSSGLEIDIYDHFNDTFRSVETLSGGESFLASLSLALGLSDEVSDSIGSVNIDTLFVDEGFGSLDPHALSGAMSVIAALSSPQRPVAIISHVEDLKGIIDKRIVVEKSPEGSRVYIDA